MSEPAEIRITERFMSGNDIPVDSVRVSAEEWDEILTELKDLRQYKWMYEDLCK